MALPGAGAGALLHPAAHSAVVDSAKRLLALAGALSPGADLRVLSRAMDELERLAAGGTAADPSDPTASTAADDDMDIDPTQPDGGTGAAAARGRRGPRAKRKREARPGAPQRAAKRRILAWRAAKYRSLVAKAAATARRARSRRAARALRPGGESGGWMSVARQLARASLGDGLHRWSPGGGGGPADAEQ